MAEIHDPCPVEIIAGFESLNPFAHLLVYYLIGNFAQF
jgi:hypothetical protein